MSGHKGIRAAASMVAVLSSGVVAKAQTRTGPCPAQVPIYAVQEARPLRQVACVFDASGQVRAAIVQRGVSGRAIVVYGPGAPYGSPAPVMPGDAIELQPGEGLTDSLESLTPETRRRLQTRLAAGQPSPSWEVPPVPVTPPLPPAVPEIGDPGLAEPHAAEDQPTDQTIIARFQYDPQGRLIKKIDEEGVRQYVYDGTSLLAEYDVVGTEVVRYEYGSDRLISLNRQGERRYYLFDALGSVTGLTDQTGAVKASYHLDAWGNFRFPGELESAGDPAAAKNRFAFTGYLWDQETELYYAKARFYDPEVGRFTTQDSYLGAFNDPPSLHRYVYANDNPVRYIDPTGRGNQELKDEYRMEREAQEAKKEREWCASQPDACAAKRVAQAEAQAKDAARTKGVFRTGGGVLLMVGGVLGAPETAGASFAATGAGIDQAITGIKEVYTGQDQKSIAGQVVEHSFKKAGVNEVEAERRAALVEAGGLVVLGGLTSAGGATDDAARVLGGDPFQSGRVALSYGSTGPRTAGVVPATASARSGIQGLHGEASTASGTAPEVFYRGMSQAEYQGHIEKPGTHATWRKLRDPGLGVRQATPGAPTRPLRDDRAV